MPKSRPKRPEHATLMHSSGTTRRAVTETDEQQGCFPRKASSPFASLASLPRGSQAVRWRLPTQSWAFKFDSSHQKERHIAGTALEYRLMHGTPRDNSMPTEMCRFQPWGKSGGCREDFATITSTLPPR
ncbi:hypothetical protein HBI42_219570 [Parastagonospora nodorum]|nr:hypothetical protein HBI47_219810 [Parastagonospora nodorum]KAH6201709.1 hypothetical protein HBI43_217120 [Parastagonospora nodorum]KAH6243398.1 hypothetical protein HBI42_219570 [Parastagonospora nodorum]